MAADATAADIKSAYRKAALKTHPDVSDAPDATQQFSQLSSAYGECLAPAVLHLPVLSAYMHALAWLHTELVGAPVRQLTGFGGLCSKSSVSANLHRPSISGNTVMRVGAHSPREAQTWAMSEQLIECVMKHFHTVRPCCDVLSESAALAESVRTPDSTVRL